MSKTTTPLGLYRCTLSHGQVGLKTGEVYELGSPAGNSGTYVKVYTKGRITELYRSRFEPASLDDAFNTTHWLDGTVTTGGVKPQAPKPPPVIDHLVPGPLQPAPADPLKDQVGGSHYKHYKIQPIEYAQANKLGPCEFNVVKYATRHKDKGGKQDLLKAIHMLQLLIQLEYPTK